MKRLSEICLFFMSIFVAKANASFGVLHAVCNLDRHVTARGQVHFFQSKIGGPVTIFGLICQISEGLHGWHVHEFPINDKKDPCGSAGGHFNPQNVTHGAPRSESRHVGDLGNFYADHREVGLVDITDHVINLVGPPELSILNRTLVIHEKKDDLGEGGNEGSLASGNAGARIGCCIITQFRKQ